MASTPQLRRPKRFQDVVAHGKPALGPRSPKPAVLASPTPRSFDKFASPRRARRWIVLIALLVGASMMYSRSLLSALRARAQFGSRLPSTPLLELDLSRPDGRVLIGAHDVGKAHPILTLMANARQQWDALTRRQSKTFVEAVDEYRRRYKRLPPRGFDRWYAFARKHHVRLIDEFDLIDKHLKPFRAFSPASLRKRNAEIRRTQDRFWTISILSTPHPGDRYAHGNDYLGQGQQLGGRAKRTRRGGLLPNHKRAMFAELLLQDFVDDLPDVEMVYTADDGAQVWLPWEERELLESHADAGTYVDDGDGSRLQNQTPRPAIDPFEAMCSPVSPTRREGHLFKPADTAARLEMPALPENVASSFVHSMSAYLDVCENPQYRHTHSTTSWTYPHREPTLPVFAPGTFGNVGDIGAIIVEDGEWVRWEPDPSQGPSFRNRTDPRAFWRGQSSGPYWDKGCPWHASHRSRIHLLDAQDQGFCDLLVTRSNDKTSLHRRPFAELHNRFLDAGMVGPPVQCSQEDGTCDQMKVVYAGFKPRSDPAALDAYRFLLDIDGNSWSGRFRTLMASSGVVLKASIFREFWTDWAIPWLHYVPVQVDLSDLHNILAFFRGDLDGRGAHSEAAEQIARAGRDWALHHYRYADLQAYQFRLVLEWGSLFQTPELRHLDITNRTLMESEPIL